MYLLECVYVESLHVHLGGECRRLSPLALLTLSTDHYFRYRECSGRRRSLEATLRRKPTCDFGIYFVIHVLKF